MNLPENPCLDCSHVGICPDSWYGCKKWNAYCSEKWPAVTRACKDSIRFLGLYRSGKNDREIAEAVGVTQQAVFQWRKRNSLPPVGKRGPKPRPDREVV